MDIQEVDRLENRILLRCKPSEIFEFMGWRFKIMECRSQSDVVTIITCYKRLFNPVGGEISVYCFPKDRSHIDEMKYAAAWLIAHWWEHYLNICPCLKDGGDHDEPSNFNKAMIESLLSYDAVTS